MIGGRRPLVPEIWSQSDRVGAKFEQQAAITPKRYKIGCQLLLIKTYKVRISVDDDLNSTRGCTV